MEIDRYEGKNIGLRQSILKLRQNKKVYIYDTPICKDMKWIQCQEREKAFWDYKINKTNYNPDPKENFVPFFGHWGIESSFFRGKTVLEIGSGPFGFFSVISRINTEYLPDELVIADPLMDFYQKFELSNMIPEKAIRLQARGEQIPFPDSTFDAILTTNTIDHVQDCSIFLREMRRLLKPQGAVFFSIHFIPYCFRALLGPLIINVDRIHNFHFTEHEIIGLFKNNGFRLETAVRMPMHKENYIPADINFIRKCLYFAGFYVMSTFYGVAKVDKDSKCMQ